MSIRVGYKASAEQFGPRQLLEFSLQTVLGRHGVMGTGADPRDALAVSAAVEHHALINQMRRMGDRVVEVVRAVAHQ